MFWQNEESGQMKAIINKFFDEEILNPIELKTLKWYIIQWIDNTKLSTIQLANDINRALIGYIEQSTDLSKRVIYLTQKELYSFVSKDLLKFGIDPF